MSATRDFMHKAPFEVRKPAEALVPFLFNSPHSGRHYPPAFLQMSCLDRDEIRLSEDRYVDCLFNGVTELGATFMAADFPRAYLDVSRDASELDPGMYDDSPPGSMGAVANMRVQAGLGCIPRVVAANKPIYAHKIPIAEAQGRLSSIYYPYHSRLRREMELLKQRFGYSVLIDCHSMPGQLRCYEGGQQPDIILGDRYGRSCNQGLTHYATLLLEKLGYRVAHNQPFAGGYITAHYGRPLAGFHALQIELNRNLYLDPQTLVPTEGFELLRHHMMRFAQAIVHMPETLNFPVQQAAE